jgi:hypothetical protein
MKPSDGSERQKGWLSWSGQSRSPDVRGMSHALFFAK